MVSLHSPLKILIGLVLMLSLAMGGTMVVTAQEENDVPPPIPYASSAGSGTFVCTDNFSLEQVTMNIEGARQTLTPDSSVRFTGTITNGNPQTIKAEKLYARVFRVNQATGAQLLIETRTIAEDLTIEGNNNYLFEDIWTAPISLGNGQYYIEYALAPFGTGAIATAHSQRFDVISNVPQAAFLSDSLTINGESIATFNRALLETGETFTIAATISNPSPEEKLLPLQWGLFNSFYPNDETSIETDTELITVGPNTDLDISYDFTVPEAQQFLISLMMDDYGAQSSLELPTTRQRPEPIVLVAGLDPVAFTAGTEMEVFYCIGSMAAEISNFDFEFRVINPANTELTSHTFTSPPSTTPHRFTISEDSAGLALFAAVLQNETRLSVNQVRYEQPPMVSQDNDEPFTFFGVDIRLVGSAIATLLLILLVALIYRRHKITI